MTWLRKTTGWLAAISTVIPLLVLVHFTLSSVASGFAAGGGAAWSKMAAPTTTNKAINHGRLCMTTLTPDFSSLNRDRE